MNIKFTFSMEFYSRILNLFIIYSAYLGAIAVVIPSRSLVSDGVPDMIFVFTVEELLKISIMK